MGRSSSILTSRPPSFSDHSLTRLPFGFGNIFIFALIIATSCGTQQKLLPKSDQDGEEFQTKNCDHICSYICTDLYPVWSRNFTNCQKEQDSCCCFCENAPKENVIRSCKEYCNDNCNQRWSGFKKTFHDCHGVPYKCECMARFSLISPYFLMTILAILVILTCCGLVAMYYYKVLTTYHIRNRNVIARHSEVDSDHLKYGNDSPPDEYEDDSEDVSNTGLF